MSFRARFVHAELTFGLLVSAASCGRTEIVLDGVPSAGGGGNATTSQAALGGSSSAESKASAGGSGGGPNASTSGAGGFVNANGPADAAPDDAEGGDAVAVSSPDAGADASDGGDAGECDSSDSIAGDADSGDASLEASADTEAGAADGGDGGSLGNACTAEDGGAAPASHCHLGHSGDSCSGAGTLACDTQIPNTVLICGAGSWATVETCAAGQTCDPAAGVCNRIAPECAGQVPGYTFCENDILMQCSASLISVTSTPCTGTCHETTCQAPLCGDGKVEPPEECDNGSNTPGSGCEPDCKTSKVLSLAAGLSHTCAILREGWVRCWGGNDYGQLGQGSTQDFTTTLPYQIGVIALGQPITALALGDYHTCALGADGSVQCWGLNDHGQLGLGHKRNIGANEVPSLAVSTVPLGAPAQAIAAGKDTTCALLTDGTVRCWGENNYGQLGLGHANDIGDNELPTQANAQVSLGDTAISIAVAGDECCAGLASQPAVRCWGYNAYNQLLVNGTANVGNTQLPTAVSPSIVMVPEIWRANILTAGGWRASAVATSTSENSYLIEWGYNDDAGLCIGATGPSQSEMVSGDTSFLQVSSGLDHLCVRHYDQTMKCWGLDSKGQLGQPADEGAQPPYSYPVVDFGQAPGGSVAYAVYIAAGQLHTCALVNTGDVKCWGYNDQGQLGLGYVSQAPTDYVGGDPTTVPALLQPVLVLPPAQ